MQGFSYKDNSFDLSDCEQYNLSIQANLDGFCILINAKENQQVLFTEYIPFRLSSIHGILRKSDEILQTLLSGNKKFNQINIITDSDQARLVPANLVSERHIKQLFPVKTRELRGKGFTSSPISAHYHLAYAFSNEMADFFRDHFNDAKIEHCMTPILHDQMRSPGDGEPNIRVHFSQNYFFVSVAREKELLFMNSFPYTTAEDILYYLTSVRKLQKTGHCSMVLSGHIDPADPGFFLINKYYQGTRLFVVPDSGKTGGNFKNLPVYRIAPLLLLSSL